MGLVQSVEVTYLIHATEDPGRIGAAVARVLATSTLPETELLEGHFGNQIVKARLHLTGEEAARAFENAVVKMPRGMKKEIISNIGSFLDEHSALFLRLDKQLLVSGSLSLATGDAVRIKVKPRIFLVKGGAAQFYSRLIGGD